MNPSYAYETPRPVTRWLPLIVVGLLVLALARTGIAIYTRNSTGLLRITTKEPNAIVSISQQNKQAAFLGKGDVSARLKPGDYLVTATLAGDRSSATVHVTSGKTTTKSINPVHTAAPLSPSSETSFINFDVLINSGLGAEQEASLERAFSDFSPRAQIVKVDPNSVETIPHDQNTDVYEMQFMVTVDSAQYSAHIEHSLFGSDVILTLTNATGNQVFNNEVVGD